MKITMTIKMYYRTKIKNDEFWITLNSWSSEKGWTVIQTKNMRKTILIPKSVETMMEEDYDALFMYIENRFKAIQAQLGIKVVNIDYYTLVSDDGRDLLKEYYDIH